MRSARETVVVRILNRAVLVEINVDQSPDGQRIRGNKGCYVAGSVELDRPLKVTLGVESCIVMVMKFVTPLVLGRAQGLAALKPVTTVAPLICLLNCMENDELRGTPVSPLNGLVRMIVGGVAFGNGIGSESAHEHRGHGDPRQCAEAARGHGVGG